MSDKPKCKQCNERDVFSKELCSGCYGKNWRLARKAEHEAVQPRQLTSGTVEADAIEGEIVAPANTHLTALNPSEMQATQGSMKAWLEDKLLVIERDIKEANAGLTEARQNGWSTAALTHARNRAVNDETFYNKILTAVEAGYTIIPDFPISVFAVRRAGLDKPDRNTFHGVVSNTYLNNPAQSDYAPAGAGEFRNPEPEVTSSIRENLAPKAQERGEPRWFTHMRRTGQPVGPITFPPTAARTNLMQATARAMETKTFDQVGICFPVVNAGGGARREVQATANRAGDPLIIGQVVRKPIGSRRKVVSFIIGWYLNLNEL